MADRVCFWRLEHLSDRQLLERLQGVLGTQRCALAELIAHLAEVEERRLHLAAAHGSLFSYCVEQLGMSEDEACRRIDLARLARRFPLLFGELASGHISLSVALLLKPMLTPDNHAELIAAARGASLRTAREMLAVRFPSPDVPSRIRKLPERPVANAMAAAGAGVADAIPVPVADASALQTGGASVPDAIPAAVAAIGAVGPTLVAGAVGPTRVTTTSSSTGARTAPAPTSSPQPHRSPALELGSLAGVPAHSLLQEAPTSREPPHAPVHAGLPRAAEPRQRIDPLSAERYRVQFTANASLKQKLELARDLLRHSHPSGDLAPIVSRALDLLLQELLQRRFGVRRKDTTHRATCTASHTAPAAAATLAGAAAMPIEPPPSSTLPFAIPVPAQPLEQSWDSARAAPSVTARPPAVAQLSMLSAAIAPARPVATPPAATIARAARRAVLERDGLGCRWVDAEGKRCGSIAWLELDHHHPSGKGGSSEPENLRLLCRAHNRFAAERAYGREHVERAIRARQRSANRPGHVSQSGQPPPSSPAPA